MTRTRYVKGTITERTGGNETYYAKGNIVINAGKSINITSGKGVFFDKPEKPQPKKDLLITKVDGPFDDKGKKVDKVKIGTYYTYKATPSRKPIESEVILLNWAIKNDNGKINSLSNVSSNNKLKDDKIIISIQVNNDCEKAIIYAYFKKLNESISVKVETDKMKPILILQGSRRKGKNRNSTGTALDMLSNDYTEDVSGFEKLRKELYNEEYNVSKQDSFYNVTSRKDSAKNQSDYKIDQIKKFCKKSNADLFKIFKNDIEYYSQGEIETVAKKMVDKMNSNSGGEFTNVNLTNTVIKHQNSITFLNGIKKVIKEYLKDNKGEIKNLEIKDDSKGLLYDKLLRDKVDNPKFSDKFSGLGITINDVWAYQVFITEYKKQGNKFEMKLEYIYWDHFGLDYPDIQKFDKDVFYSWFVLQHFKGYKPFYTKIDIVGDLKGEF